MLQSHIVRESSDTTERPYDGELFLRVYQFSDLRLLCSGPPTLLMLQWNGPLMVELRVGSGNNVIYLPLSTTHSGIGLSEEFVEQRLGRAISANQKTYHDSVQVFLKADLEQLIWLPKVRFFIDHDPGASGFFGIGPGSTLSLIEKLQKENLISNNTVRLYRCGMLVFGSPLRLPLRPSISLSRHRAKGIIHYRDIKQSQLFVSPHTEIVIDPQGWSLGVPTLDMFLKVTENFEYSPMLQKYIGDYNIESNLDTFYIFPLDFWISKVALLSRFRIQTVITRSSHQQTLQNETEKCVLNVDFTPGQIVLGSQFLLMSCAFFDMDRECMLLQ